jgi:hypothetical protein
MNDIAPIKPADDLQYSKTGAPFGPQPKPVLGALLALAIPVIAILSVRTAPFPSLLLQKTSLFKIMIFHFHMSADQVANFEWLLWLLALVETGNCVWFFHVRAAKYSQENPPLLQLKLAWPRQFIGIIAIGAVFVSVPFLIGAATHAGWLFDESIDVRITRSMLLAISIGLVLVIDGLASGALYGYFFLKYWRRAS